MNVREGEGGFETPPDGLALGAPTTQVLPRRDPPTSARGRSRPQRGSQRQSWLRRAFATPPATGRTLLGLLVLGVGVAVVVLTVLVLRQRATPLWIAGVSLGVALLGLGVAVLLDKPSLDAVALLGLGTAAVIGGLARVLDKHAVPRLPGTVGGAALALGGVALVGLAVAVGADLALLFAVCVLLAGVALTAFGASVLLEATTPDWVAGVGGLLCAGGVALAGYGLIMMVRRPEAAATVAIPAISSAPTSPTTMIARPPTLLPPDGDPFAPIPTAPGSSSPLPRRTPVRPSSD